MLNRNLNSINCATASDWMHLLLDEELSETRLKLLSAHLEACEKCRTALHELKLLERAHARLDLRLKEPPADYFAQLPKRVSARLEAEKAAAPVVLEMPVPKPRVLWLQKFATGKGKYAVALAAAAALIFFLAREKDQSPSLATSQQREPAAFTSDTMASAVVEPLLQAPGSAERTPQEDSAQRPATDAPLVAMTPAPARREETLADAAITREVEGRAAGGKRFELGRQSRQPESQSKDELVQVALPASGAGVAALPAESTAHLPLPEYGDLGKTPESSRSKEIMSLHRSASTSALAEAKQQQKIRTESVSARFSLALQHAQAAPDAKARQKIWRDFLETNPDTAYYYLAIGNLARSLSAAADSGSNTEQIDQTLQFYQQMEAILAPQLGVESVRFERARLEGLLRWKSQSEGRKTP